MAKEKVKKEKKGTLKVSQIVLYGVFGMFVNTFYLMYLTYNRIYYLTNVLQLNETLSAVVASASAWINVLTMMLDALGFDLIIKDRNSSNKDNTWKIEVLDAVYDENNKTLDK